MSLVPLTKNSFGELKKKYSSFTEGCERIIRTLEDGLRVHYSITIQGSLVEVRMSNKVDKNCGYAFFVPEFKVKLLNKDVHDAFLNSVPKQMTTVYEGGVRKEVERAPTLHDLPKKTEVDELIKKAHTDLINLLKEEISNKFWFSTWWNIMRIFESYIAVVEYYRKILCNLDTRLNLCKYRNPVFVEVNKTYQNKMVSYYCKRSPLFLIGYPFYVASFGIACCGALCCGCCVASFCPSVMERFDAEDDKELLNTTEYWGGQNPLFSSLVTSD